jgi:hypothetical protein
LSFDVASTSAAIERAADMREQGTSAVRLQPSLPAEYEREIDASAPRLLSMLDREPLSATFGSFDRENWAWKFRDHPLMMLQAGLLPLGLLWSRPYEGNPYYANDRVRSWIEGGLQSILSRQRSNGSFDSVGPFTQDHGVTLAMVHTMVTTARRLGSAWEERVRQPVASACEFARKTSEGHAFISNHQSLFALAWLDAAELLGRDRFREVAAETVREILARQSQDGWYAEYGGPDPGYESLGVFYLAQVWRRTADSTLLASLGRSLEFLAHCVHPDGSLGGVYGSRQTALYYPGGFEILADVLPMAAAVARFQRSRLTRRNVVTPTLCDAENLPSLLQAYVEAALNAVPGDVDVTPLPCEHLQGLRAFRSSGVVAAGADRYYAVANLKKGGVCRVFDRRVEQLAYEDAGYVIDRGSERAASQLAAPGSESIDVGDHSASSSVAACRVNQEIMTTGRFLLLRLLNVTVFRSRTVAAWLRSAIVRRLILSRRLGGVSVQRRIAFRRSDIVFDDTLTLTAPGTVTHAALTRGFIGIHMGSARYFHGSDLHPDPAVSTAHLAHELNRAGRAHVRFVLRFTADRVSIVAGDVGPGGEDRT